MLDPGIGFGKTVEHNLELLRRLGELVELGRPGRDRYIAQVVSGQDHGARGRRPRRGDGRDQRTRVRTRRAGLPGPRRGPGARRARGHGCYGQRAMDDPDEYDESDDEDDEGGAPRARGHDRGQRVVAVHARGRDRGRARGRPAAAARPADRCRRVRRDGHRPDRGHGRLRPGVRHREPRRPAAHLQDARATVRGDRRPADRAVRRRCRLGQGRQARAADGAAGRARCRSRCGARPR